jgi:Ran GTPase-activating protein (RanGAP) involved in mRNA processing and transport
MKLVVSEHDEADLIRQPASVELSELAQRASQSIQRPADQLPSTFEDFLIRLGIDIDGLEAIGCNVEKLNRLYDIEIHPILSRLHWMNIDFLFERILMYLFLDKAGVSTADKNKTWKPGPRLWLHGRGLPFKSRHSAGKATAAVFFRAGFEMTLLTILDTTLVTLLIYQWSQKEDVVNTFFSNDSTAIRNLIFAAAGKYGNIIKGTIIPVMLFPVFWGTCLAAWNAQRQIFHYKQPAIRRLLRNTKRYPVGIWEDLFRWLLPRPPLNEQINQLQSLLRWNGDLDSPAQREELFNALAEHAGKRRGYSRIVLYWKIAELAEVPAFSQFHLLQNTFNTEEMATFLKIKSKAFELIIRNKENALAEALKYPSVQNSAYFMYLHYLQWSLGDAKLKPSTFFFVFYKLAKLGLSSYLFARIIKEIIAYYRCPDAPLNFDNGLPSVDHLLSLNCFNRFLKQFRTVPNEPITELTDKLGSFKLRGNIAVDLSNKELSAKQLIIFLETFSKEQPQATITTLNLAGNQIHQTGAVAQLMPFLAKVETLNMSRNDLGQTPESIDQFAEGLRQLPYLKSLNLTDNNLGQGVNDFTQALTLLIKLTFGHPSLTFLDLSYNLLGGADELYTEEKAKNLQATATQLQAGKSSSITHLKLNHNLFDFASSFSSHMLSMIIARLDQLKSLTLNHNFLGMYGSDGFVALSQSLAFKKNLNELLLDYNFIELIDSNGTQALGRSLQTIDSLNVTSATFNMLGKHDPNGMVELFSGLASQNHLSELTLKMNYIDLTDSVASRALKNAMSSFRHLKVLDFSMNELGRTDSLGTTAFADGFVYLQELQSLSLENNRIKIDSPDAFESWKNLAGLKHLTHLNLAGNQIGLNSAEGGKAIAAGIKQMYQLTSLDLSGNALGSYSQTDIPLLADAIKDKPALTQFSIQPQEGRFNIGGVETDPAQSLNVVAMSMPSHKPLRLITPDAAKNYINRFPRSTTKLDLSNLFDAPSQLICIKMMQAIQSHFTNLTSFTFSHNKLGFTPYGLRAFAIELSYLSSLEHLDLSNNFFSVNSLKDMSNLLTIAFRDLTKLKTLKLSDNFIGLSGITEKALGASFVGLQQLEDINLYNNWLGFSIDNGIYILGEALSGFNNLLKLNLSQNWIGVNGFSDTQAFLKGVSCLPKLQTIDFSANPLAAEAPTSATGDIFLNKKSVNNASLVFANFSNCLIGLQGSSVLVGYLSKLVHSTRLTTLDLTVNYLGATDDEATFSIAQALAYATNLQRLFVSNNPIGLQGNLGPSALSDTLKKLDQLTDLNMSEVALDDQTWILIVNSLQNHTNLQSLDLSVNSFDFSSSEAGIRLGNLLSNFSNLRSLNLQKTWLGFVSPNDIISLAKGIVTLKQLESLYLNGANIGNDDGHSLNILVEALSNKTFLHTFDFLPQWSLGSPSLQTRITFPANLIDSINHALKMTNVTLPITQGLTSPERIQQYLAFFPSHTTLLNFSTLFNAKTSAETFSSLMQGLGSFQSLTTLDLSNNNLGQNAQGIEALGIGFVFTSQLEQLILNNNTLGALEMSSAKEFAQGLEQLQNLKKLHLSNNQLNSFSQSQTVLDVLALNGLQFLTRLETINLSCPSNNLIPLPTAGLAVALKQLTQLLQLDFSFCTIALSLTTERRIQVEHLMATLGKLRKLEDLNLESNILKPVGFELAASLKLLINLRFLNLKGNYFFGKSCESIGKNLNAMRSLKKLNLASNNWGGDSIYSNRYLHILGNSLAKLVNLSSFDIRFNLIGFTGINETNLLAHGLTQKAQLTELLFFPQTNKLIQYDFSSYKLLYDAYNHPNSLKIMSFGALADFLQKLNLNTLTTLDLASRFNAPSPALASLLLVHIEDHHGWPALKTLILSNNNLAFSSQVFSLIANIFPLVPNLENLDLSANQIGLADETSTLDLALNLPFLTNLKTLNLSDNWMGSSSSIGTIRLAEAIGKLTQLEELYLNDNNFGFFNTDGSSALFAALSNLKKLKVLHLGDNNFGISGHGAISTLGNSFASMQQLRYLNLSYNYIGLSYIGPYEPHNTFFSGLKHLIHLQVLDLTYNNIGQVQPDNVADLAVSLQPLNQLRCLWLDQNNLGRQPNSEAKIDQLLETLAHLPQIESLRLYKNNITFHTTSAGQILAKQKSEDLTDKCHDYACHNKTFTPNVPVCTVASTLVNTVVNTSPSSRLQPIGLYRQLMAGVKMITGWMRTILAAESEDLFTETRSYETDRIDTFLDEKLSTEASQCTIYANPSAFFSSATSNQLLINAEVQHAQLLGH